MEKEILENIKIHYTLKHLHSEMFNGRRPPAGGGPGPGDFYNASKHLESEMANDPKLARRVIEEYWDDYFKNRPLYI